MIKIYSDGSCKPNPGQAGVGFVILENEQPIKVGSIFLGPGTNNIAELKAVELALKELKELGYQDKAVELITDSQYAVGLFTKNWKAKANTELVNKIRKDIEEFPYLIISWIKGHDGNMWNERVDQLANQAIDNNK